MARRRTRVPGDRVPPRKVDKLIAAAKASASKFENAMFAEMYVYAIEQQLLHGNSNYLKFIKNLREAPVDIETFLDSEEFLGATDLKLWPEVRKAIVDINKDWWKGPKVAKTEAILMGACVDSESEFLTPSGWKKISEYKEGDTVGQYHEDGSLTFVEPTKYVKRPHTMFHHFRPRGGLDMVLTPGHRVIYRSKNTGELREMSAEDVARKQNTLAQGFKGQFLSTFTPQGREGISLSHADIRVMVMVHAYGSFYEENSPWCNLILKKPRKVERARQLLDDAGIKYTDTDHDGGEYRRIRFYAPERNKTYKGWWACTEEQLRTVVDEVMFWDGCDLHGQYYTTKREEADFIQYAMLATGRRSTMQWQKRKGRSTEYRVKLCKKDTYSMASTRPSKVEYAPASDGHCYCFTLPTGMWLMRRGGQVVVTGNTGTGKSECAKVTQAYHLHILGCMKSPQAIYGLPKATSVVVVIQAAKPHVTKKVIYLPLRNYVETMPWFQKHMRPNKLIDSEMYFDELNIRVVPGGSEADTILGEAIISGIVDEINFMNVVQKSKKADVGTGRSGLFDQAKSIYDAITRRRKGRFTFQGPQVGCIVIASSTRYKGDFTDQRKAYVEEHDIRTTYIYNKAQYEVAPQSRYSGEKFTLFVSNEAAADIRIVEDDAPPTNGTIFDVPIEYIDEFRKDPAGALRDIIGRSANAVNPFFRQQHKIMECVTLGIEAGVESFLTKDNVVLGLEGLPLPVRGHFCRNPSRPRYVHIDLSKNQDRCGVGMVRYDGMEEVRRNNGNIEYLPMATVEMAVSIEPDHGNEIDPAEIRSWVKMLHTKYGYPIKAVTYDGWNSMESQQAWKKQGMKTGQVSVDRSSAPYKQFRDGLYDGRIKLHDQPLLLQELFDLEYDAEKDKIDHPVHSTKDCADGVCGAYHTMLTRASSWVGHNNRDDEDADDEDRAYDERHDVERHDIDRG